MKKISKSLVMLLIAQLILTCWYGVKDVHAATNLAEKNNDNYSNINADAKEQATTLVNNYGATSVQYAMMDDNNIVVSGSSGVYSKNNNKKITDDTMYGIGSTSKIFTATAVMKLVESGKVDLDKPVVNYIQDFIMKDKRYKEITTRMLLNHSSGLMGTETSRADLFDDNDTANHDKFLAKLKTQRLNAEPGKFSVYCNDGFTLAEILVERVSGKSFTKFIHENITTPLKLKNTKTPQDDFDRANLAKTYNQMEPTLETPPETMNAIGAGGIYSTAEEMCKFGSVFTKKSTLLSKKSVDQMCNEEYKNGLWLDNIDDTESIINYGLGFDGTNIFPFSQYGIKAISKGGDITMYHSIIVILPEYNMIAAVNSSGGSSVTNEILACNILLESLKEKGIIKEIKSNKSFEVATQTPINEDIKKYEGLYAASQIVTNVKINDSGIMTISSQTPATDERKYIHTGNGVFFNDEGSEKITFEEKDSKIYLRSDSYINLEGIGQTAVAEYIGQKIEKNKLTAEVTKAWEDREGKKYFDITDKYDSIALRYNPTFTCSPLDNGYEISNKVIDKDKAISVIEIPVMSGRDVFDYNFFAENNVEYLKAADSILISEDGLKEISEGNSSCTIKDKEDNIWYKINEKLNGKKMTVKLPKNSGFVVYTKDGVCTNQSVLTKTNTEVLPGGGYIMFGGKKGTEFKITIK